MKKLIIAMALSMASLSSSAFTLDCKTYSFEIGPKVIVMKNLKAKKTSQWIIDYSEYTDGSFYITRDANGVNEGNMRSIFQMRLDTQSRTSFLKVPVNTPFKVDYYLWSYEIDLDYENMITSEELTCTKKKGP